MTTPEIITGNKTKQTTPENQNGKQNKTNIV